MSPFAGKLLLGFLVGGCWTVVATVVGERQGTKIGGVIAGLPSAIVVALFFIGWTQSPEAAAESTVLIPLVGGIIPVFTVVYVFLYPVNFYLAVIGSLGAWLALIGCAVALGVDDYVHSLICFVALLPLGYFLVEKVQRVESESHRAVRYTAPLLLLRGLLGGGIITFAVIVARYAGVVIGGAFAAFPTVMLSTIIVNHFAHGRAFATAFLKAMMVAGSVNLVVYSTVVRFAYPTLGLFYGTGLAFLVSLASGYAVHLFVQRKML